MLQVSASSFCILKIQLHLLKTFWAKKVLPKEKPSIKKEYLIIRFLYFWHAKVRWPLLCLCRPFVFLKDVWIRTQRENRLDINLATHPPIIRFYYAKFPWTVLIFEQNRESFNFYYSLRKFSISLYTLVLWGFFHIQLKYFLYRFNIILQ